MSKPLMLSQVRGATLILIILQTEYLDQEIKHFLIFSNPTWAIALVTTELLILEEHQNRKMMLINSAENG